MGRESPATTFGMHIAGAGGMAGIQSDQIVVTRRIAAPAERVFDAWLNSGEMETWMAPPGRDATMIVSVLPLVNGRFRINSIDPDKTVHEHVGAYLELDRPRRLVFTWVSERVAHRETVVQVDIDPIPDNGCELRLTHTGLTTDELLSEHERGWGELLDQLAALVTRK